ncbi:hypothetical protein KUF71_009461 [Frankliniella fusca]|uniref:Uncharacterized protein n=1 Tax=Frankliniella fusca TaxID=407009 RepID=A0AAE1HF26_9NEOP|nr:hypothetical protein KUF71_009461 [Frankliniella fusca]
MFLNTLGISAQTVKTALAKKKHKFGVISPNKMGKAEKKTPESKKIDQSVRRHIERFPTVDRRVHLTIRYIDEHLNRRKMYKMYAIECQAANLNKKDIASLRRYQDIFKTYKLRFYKPKKDQCSKCLAWKHKSPQSKKQTDQVKMDEHLRQKDLGRNLKETDAKFVVDPNNRKELCVLTCDLQKIMSSSKVLHIIANADNPQRRTSKSSPAVPLEGQADGVNVLKVFSLINLRVRQIAKLPFYTQRNLCPFQA